MGVGIMTGNSARKIKILDNSINFTLNSYTLGNGITENTENVKTWFSNTRIDIVGKMAMLTVNVLVKEINNYTGPLMTLDESLRPSRTVAMNSTTNNGKPCYLYIDPDGEAGLTLSDMNGTFEEDDGIRIIIPYYLDHPPGMA